MENTRLYQDIAKRTDGDIYVSQPAGKRKQSCR